MKGYRGVSECSTLEGFKQGEDGLGVMSWDTQRSKLTLEAGEIWSEVL